MTTVQSVYSQYFLKLFLLRLLICFFSHRNLMRVDSEVRAEECLHTAI